MRDDYTTPLTCPFCDSQQIRVPSTEPHGDHIMRTRKCKVCGKTWRTIEVDFDMFRRTTNGAEEE